MNKKIDLRNFYVREGNVVKLRRVENGKYRFYSIVIDTDFGFIAFKLPLDKVCDGSSELKVGDNAVFFINLKTAYCFSVRIKK